MSYSFKSANQSVIQQDKRFFQPGASFTFLIWAKGNIDGNMSGILCSLINSAVPNSRLWMENRTTIPRLFVDNLPSGGSGYDINLNDPVDPNTWLPWVCRYDSDTNTVDFYVGQDSKSVTGSAIDVSSVNRTSLGAATDPTPSYGDSKLEHFACWNENLDDGFIQDLLNGKNPLDVASPVAYMPLIAGLDDVIGFYDNMQLVGSPPPVLTDDNAPVDRPDIITLWKWSGNDAAGNPVYNSTLEDLADGTTPGTIPTWIKINYAPPPGFGGGLVGGIVGGRQPGDSLLGRDQQGDLTGLTGNLLSNLTGLGNDFDSYDYWP